LPKNALNPAILWDANTRQSCPNGLHLAATGTPLAKRSKTRVTPRGKSMESSSDTLHKPERRLGIDRRQIPKAVFNRYWFGGKRSRLRRAEDIQKPYQIDRYGLKTFAAILLIIGLSLMDALLTLQLINNDAKELNPVMAYFLNHGPFVFFGAKYFLTCAPIVCILPLKGFYLFHTKIRGTAILTLILISFILVIYWELYLLYFHL
jgi:hypothetical protein